MTRKPGNQEHESASGGRQDDSFKRDIGDIKILHNLRELRLFVKLLSVQLNQRNIIKSKIPKRNI